MLSFFFIGEVKYRETSRYNEGDVSVWGLTNLDPGPHDLVSYKLLIRVITLQVI